MDLDPDAFRLHGHALVEWIAEYLSSSERYPVLPRVQPGDVRRALPGSPPEHGEPFDRILADFEHIIVPALTHWNHPGFFGYFAISSTGAGVLAEFLAAAINQQAMLWKTSPASTELEEVALGWLRELIGLPASFEGVIYDTASISSLHALAAARHAAIPDVRRDGLAASGTRWRVYCSDHAHSSIDKAVILLGLGHSALRRISVDDDFRMRGDALAAAVSEDCSAGIVPIAVVATIGTTSSTSVDPVSEVANVCERHRIWLHVDAAYAGAAAMLPECRSHFAGWERADSVVLNPHKWLFTPFDLSAFYSRRMNVVREAFSLVPDYLATAEGDRGVRNLMDTGIQLGRRFRSLKLWMLMRQFGSDGLRAALRDHLRLARRFAQWVDDEPLFERVAPVPFSVVCFRARPDDRMTDAQLDTFNATLLEAVNAAGDVFLSHTRLNGRFVIRLAIGNVRTREQHVQRAWDLLKSNTVQLARNLPL